MLLFGIQLDLEKYYKINLEKMFINNQRRIFSETYLKINILLFFYVIFLIFIQILKIGARGVYLKNFHKNYKLIFVLADICKI